MSSSITFHRRLIQIQQQLPLLSLASLTSQIVSVTSMQTFSDLSEHCLTHPVLHSWPSLSTQTTGWYVETSTQNSCQDTVNTNTDQDMFLSFLWRSISSCSYVEVEDGAP